MPNVPDTPAEAYEAARKAIFLNKNIGMGQNLPAYHSDEALAKAAVDAAMPILERDIRALIAASLRRAAAGRREYAATFGETEARWQLLMHARCDESSAAIIEDPRNLLDAVPSWLWTDEERTSLREDGNHAG